MTHEEYISGFLKEIGAERMYAAHDKARRVIEAALSLLALYGTRGYSYRHFCCYLSGPNKISCEEACEIFSRYACFFRQEADAAMVSSILRNQGQCLNLSDFDTLRFSAGYIRRSMRKNGGIDKMDERGKTAAFAGPASEEQSPIECGLLSLAVENELSRSIADGFEVFYFNMLGGTDLLAAETVLKMKAEFPHIKLFCIHPSKEQESGWHPSERLACQHILDMADHVEDANQNRAVKSSYFRSEYMLDRCDRLIAVCNEENRCKAAQIIRYAEMMGVEMRYINPAALAVGDAACAAISPRRVTLH